MHIANVLSATLKPHVLQSLWQLELNVTLQTTFLKIVIFNFFYLLFVMHIMAGLSPGVDDCCLEWQHLE